jgi:4-hydroxy-tetrahydrodipicolinate reductase
MKLALLGFGNMGQHLHSLATAQGHEIVSVIDPTHPKATHTHLAKEALAEADVCIDFTKGEAVVDNVRQVMALGKPLVIGTTGWERQHNAVQALVTSSTAGAVYGANFSIGVHLFYAMVQHAAELFRGFTDYAVAGVEFHHSQKRDRPSGTALTLTHILQAEMGAAAKTFAFNSVRSGHYPGTHALTFDSAHDTIELRHTARSRQGFAEGALMAAQWIRGRVGLHTVEAMILDIALQAQEVPQLVE